MPASVCGSFDVLLGVVEEHRDIINQVANMRSDIGILYLSEFNKQVIGKLLREKHLEFHPLFRAPLHVFISRDNPLAMKKKLTMEDLKPYPFIQYEHERLHREHVVLCGDRAQLFARFGVLVAFLEQ